jgi:hypothetical protein
MSVLTNLLEGGTGKKCPISAETNTLIPNGNRVIEAGANGDFVYIADYGTRFSIAQLPQSEFFPKAKI